MLTRVTPSPETITPIETPELIQEQVDEKGFYLYEWISPDELKMTLDRDYLQIVRWASIPLAIITGIAGFIGSLGGPIGAFFAVLAVLGIFYALVAVILFVGFIRRAYLYTRGANVVITDDHYVSGGVILGKGEKARIQERLKIYENTFDEPFLGVSRLAEKKAQAQKALFDNLKEVAYGGGRLIEGFGRSRDSGGLIVVMMIAGILYAVMMAITYFLGIFFISLFGRLFSWGAHRYLLATNNREHHIQTLFSELDMEAKDLQKESSTSLSLLGEANQNAWKENLLTKINTSLALLSRIAGRATDDSKKLRELLESSEYKDIFNFVKYGNWIKKQILDPIESILLLLEKNYDILQGTITDIEKQIQETDSSALRGPLELQKERLKMQVESFEKNINLLREYQKKLQY